MGGKYETQFRKTWDIRDRLREIIRDTKEFDEQGYVTRSLERVDMDLTSDLKYLLPRIRYERGREYADEDM